jgi:hypothetical protein
VNSVPTLDPPARLVDAVELARSAAVEEAAVDMGHEAAAGAVGEHLEARPEGEGAVTHYFAATQGGYRGWRWSVTIATADDDAPITVSEVVLLPGSGALVAPEWMPWSERVRPGDLGANEYSPADGAVVEVGFGCGAHSDVRHDPVSPVTVAEVVYDDGVDLEPVGRG